MKHPYLPTLIELVQLAGQATLPFWRNSVAVEQKADDSPVTAADLAAHQILADGLQKLAPEVPIVSEEDSEISLAERASWQRWWLVDPLDGTKEFIAGSEEFTVNVALIDSGRVVLGIVGVPATGVCYYGGAAFGAWRRSADGVAQRISVRSDSEALTVVASKRHSSAAQEQLLSGLSARLGVLELASIGSSLKFCLLAEGEADCYPRLAPTSQWDTAAAQGVLEGAGGEVLDLQGQPLRYEARESYLNPSFLAVPAQAPWRAELLELARQLD